MANLDKIKSRLKEAISQSGMTLKSVIEKIFYCEANRISFNPTKKWMNLDSKRRKIGLYSTLRKRRHIAVHR